MSKIFPREVLQTYVNVLPSFINRELSSPGGQLFSVINQTIANFIVRCNSLGNNLNSLDSNQLTEFEDLKEFVKEYSELTFQALTNEEIQSRIDVMSPISESLSPVDKIRLDALLNVQESKKLR